MLGCLSIHTGPLERIVQILVYVMDRNVDEVFHLGIFARFVESVPDMMVGFLYEDTVRLVDQVQRPEQDDVVVVTRRTHLAQGEIVHPPHGRPAESDVPEVLIDDKSWIVVVFIEVKVRVDLSDGLDDHIISVHHVAVFS